jgi:hypothetical protein
VDAGTYIDLVKDHDSERTISFSFKLSTEEQVQQSVTFPPGPPELLEMLAPLTTIRPGQLELQFRPEGREILLTKWAIQEAGTRRALLTRSRSDTGSFSLGGSLLKHVRSVLKSSKTADRLLTELRGTTPTNFFFNPQGTFNLTPGLVNELGPKPEQAPFNVTFNALIWMVIRIAEIESQAQAPLFNLIEPMRYLGPLRATPRRWYELSGVAPEWGSPSGELTPEVLYRALPDERAQTQSWLSRFGVAEKIDFVECGPETFSLLLSGSGRKSMNLADVGFGVSQLLPVISEVTRIQKGQCLILEQPEIHLNPRLQTMLGDLIATVPALGGRVIVETHSEHLLTRIRTLLARQTLSASDVALYFTQNVHGQSDVRNVALGQNGGIARADWPTGFFGESLHEAIELTSAQAGRGA